MKESTSLKEGIKILRNEDKKSEQGASRSRGDGKVLEEQRDEANREAREVNQELDRLNKEITKGRMKSGEASEAKDKKILELQRHKAEEKEDSRREHENLAEGRKKESEANQKQISDLQIKTTDLKTEQEAAKNNDVKLWQQVEQKDEAKMAREQNWDEYRQFWELSAAPSTHVPQLLALSLLSDIHHLRTFRREFV